jgi:hypothetical protein
MHGRTTAGAVGVFRRDRHIDARQMGGKRTAIDAALVAARPCGHGVLFVVGGLVAGNGLLDILKGEEQLLGIKLLRTPAELRALQLAQQVPQAIHLRQRLVALRDRDVPLRARCRDQRMQRFDVARKLMCDLAHASTKPDSRTVVIRPRAGDSKSRRSSRRCRRPRNVAHVKP